MLIFGLVNQQSRLEHLLLIPADITIGILKVTQIINALTGINLPDMGCGMAGVRQLLLADNFNQVINLPIVIFMPNVVNSC